MTAGDGRILSGAESLVHTLLDSGVEVCFANPGTSEMHFVSALDRIDGMHCVLALFEGVATGAADGYYRLAGRPASTLLHLGPGLANGLANLHNARKARSGIVNVVGEHAQDHVALDAPLTSDIEGVARPMSDWVRTCRSTAGLGDDAAQAVAAASSRAGRVATLVLPADVAWGSGGIVGGAVAATQRTAPDDDAVERAGRALRVPGAALLLGGAALRGRALESAGRIAAKTGCRLLAENLNPRMERGAGRVKVERLPYPVQMAIAQLKEIRHLVLCGARAPVGFFAYPDQPSVLTSPACEITPLADVDGDMEATLGALAQALDATSAEPVRNAAAPSAAAPRGALSAAGIGAVLSCCLPDDAVVIDESITTGRAFGQAMDGAAPHDWLNSMGGSIGFGLPLALGAAIAAPRRQVVALEGDGSALYTPQALWSMAREGSKVLTLVFANRSYEILKGELANVGAGAPGPKARDMLTIDRPDIDWCALSLSLGVEAGRASTLEDLGAQLERGLRADGPYLVEVML